MTLFKTLGSLITMASDYAATVSPSTNLVVARIIMGRANSPIGTIEYTENEHDRGKTVIDQAATDLSANINKFALFSVRSDKKRFALGSVCHVSVKFGRNKFEELATVPVTYDGNSSAADIELEHSNLLKSTLSQYVAARKFLCGLDKPSYNKKIKESYDIELLPPPKPGSPNVMFRVHKLEEPSAELSLADWFILGSYLRIDPTKALPTVLPGGDSPLYCINTK